MAALPFVFSSIDNALSESITQNTAGVSVTGNYSTNITLSNAIFNNSITSIKSITSNESTDSPAVYTYNSVSRVLTVSGLNSGASLRTLAVNFNIPSTTLPDFMTTFLSLLRWFWVFIIIGMTAGAIYAFFD